MHLILEYTSHLFSSEIVKFNSIYEENAPLKTLRGCKGKRLYIFLILNFLYVMRFSMIFNMQLLKNIKKSNKIPKNNEKENSIHFCS